MNHSQLDNRGMFEQIEQATRFKPKARFEGGGISGVCRIIQATDKQIATTFGTFNLRAGRWVWEVNYAVRLFPVPKEEKP